MKKSGIISFLRVVLVLLYLLTPGVLLISILMVKPLWIGLSVSFFAMMAAFQNHDQFGVSEKHSVLGDEKNNAY